MTLYRNRRLNVTRRSHTKLGYPGYDWGKMSCLSTRRIISLQRSDPHHRHHCQNNRQRIQADSCLHTSPPKATHQTQRSQKPTGLRLSSTCLAQRLTNTHRQILRPLILMMNHLLSIIQGIQDQLDAIFMFGHSLRRHQESDRYRKPDQVWYEVISATHA